MGSFNSDKVERKRLFVGIKVDYTDQIHELVSRIKGKLNNSHIRWTSSSNYHITIAFIGSVDLQKSEEINKALIKNSLDLQELTLNISGIGYFGESKPRVLWCGVEENTVLELLFQKIVKVLNTEGVCLDYRHGTPHVTIGRIKKLDSEIKLDTLLKPYSEEFIQTVVVKEIVLFESKTHPDGPQYTQVNTYGLS